MLQIKSSHSLLTAGLLSVALSMPAAAAKETTRGDKEVAIGLGTGAVVGTIIAGPAGAIVAAVFGAMIGNDQVQNAELAASREALNETQEALFAMHDELAGMQQQARLTRVNYQAEPEYKVLALESSVQFKTGSVTIEPEFEGQLDRIAKSLTQHPSLTIRLTGHADNRGDAAFNQALSMQRALSVKKYLTGQGVAANQILTVAVGEQESRAESYEDTFFDRRVVLHIAEEGETLTAQR
ncbi:sortase-associated OmpA-like protein PdsO [Alteromonas sp. ASW11-19]|uniref:Sortase-associated OmpA-like protein PdsO n=1 Tax=Alteromonas salexigens TaxID=2982530 RepID=A0ABT2VML2_9ALTE|nr:sortase-associated OmpA-like protein PdsO [Alteromonas salexigens]MCU7554557.1 sortase-associated OmpA-like protein PdsO [Alteromonas salexigens]